MAAHEAEGREAHRPDLVIFDCDGVLIESERIAVRIEATQLTRCGWPLTEAEVVERFSGRSEEFMVREVAARLGEAAAKAWIAQFWDHYWTACATELRPVDGVIDALDRISVPTCVASSSSHEALRGALGFVGLYERFAGRIFSASDVPRGKPASDLFLHAAARVGVSPASCAVVEDSPAGVQAARSAGMRAFAYAGGLSSADRLEGPRTIVFREMRNLPRLLGFADESP